MADCYVYVYIDPRNNEEFYYGKGQGSRKDAHLTDASDSAKANRIQAIRKEGLEPTIRVIARGLTEDEALLIEKTLLWKLGRLTTNVASGHFAEKFRPADTLHHGNALDLLPHEHPRHTRYSDASKDDDHESNETEIILGTAEVFTNLLLTITVRPDTHELRP